MTFRDHFAALLAIFPRCHVVNMLDTADPGETRLASTASVLLTWLMARTDLNVAPHSTGADLQVIISCGYFVVVG